MVEMAIIKQVAIDKSCQLSSAIAIKVDNSGMKKATRYGLLFFN